MAFTPNANFRKSVSRGDVEPIVKMEIQVPYRVFLRVVDYTEGAGDTVTIPVTAPEPDVVLTEGVDFDAETTNAVTAANIRDAINASPDARGNFIAKVASFDPEVVEVIFLDANDTAGWVITSDVDAWVVVGSAPQPRAAWDVEGFDSGTNVGVTYHTRSLSGSGASNTIGLTSPGDFSISSSSRETTALSIADAVNADATLSTLFHAYAVGRRVWIVGYGPTITRFAITSTDEPNIAVVEVFGRSFTYVSGTRNLFGYQPSIATFTPPRRSKNALTNEHSVSEGSARFVDDGNIRHVMSSYMLKGATVRYFLGTPSLNESDFQSFPDMIVDEVLQDSAGSIDVTLVDALGALRDIHARVRMGGVHPLEAGEALLRLALPARRVGQNDVAEEWFNFATFDFSLYEDRSHFVVSRTDNRYRTFEPDGEETGVQETYDRRMTEPEAALDMLNELLLCADGSLRPGDDGRYEFVPLDLSAAADHVWSCGPVTGYDCEAIEQKSALDSIIAEVSFSHCGGQARTSLKSQDAFIAARFSFLVTLDSPWINALSHTAYDIDGIARPLADSHTGFTIENAQRFGFSGTGGMDPGSISRDDPSRLANQTTRPIFFRIHSGLSQFPELDEDDFEIVAIKSATVISNSDWFYGTPTVSLGNNRDQWIRFEFADTYEDDELGFDAASDGRGGLGTVTPANWGTANFVIDRVWITDITIPVFVARQRLARFKFGAPVVRVRVGLSKIGVQLGDVVNLVGDDLFLGHMMDGADANIFWEVTDVQEIPLGDDPGIDVELTFLRREDVVLVPGFAVDPGDGSFANDTADLNSNIVVDNDGNEIWIDEDGDTVLDTPVVI